MATILLVDDEKVARTVYGDYLTEAGHTVTCVGSVAEARAALALHPVDLVVTDLILPAGDGMDVLQHTRERYPGVEVVVITALDKVDPAVRAIKNGAAEYLVKPVKPEALNHAVNRALMTRALLAENAALKRHLSLVEAGQRLLTTLDRPRLAQTAGSAFLQLSGAEGVLLWSRSGETVRLESSEGVSAEALRHLVVRYDAELPNLPTRSFDAAWPEGPGRVLGFPVGEGGRHRGWALLLTREAATETLRETAEYLARHLSLAWSHAERFAHVEDLAYLDDLTRLYNARYLDEALDRELHGKSPFSLLFLDLDHFKSVNDTHGHLVGSKLLVEAARVVKSCTRDQDVVARWGGDEYVVLLRETDSGGALKVAERIRRTVESHSFLAREGYGLGVTVCIGVASHPEHGIDRRTLLDLADRAMYRGKRTSRNVVYVATPSAEEVVKRSGAA
jgi:diguanylate cyclase (GGDEF)-like protein